MTAKSTANSNRPTIGALVVAFTTALMGWALELVPDTVPTEVSATGYVLAVTVVAVAVGKAAQGEVLRSWLEAEAPWAHDNHAAAVAYALTLDRSEHAEDLDRLLPLAGVSSVDEAARLIGCDPEDLR